MVVAPAIAAIRNWKQQLKPGRRVALVPTMGALHDGHLALVRHAATLADEVVVSIFVNPTQFGPNEDLDKYPRTLEMDLKRCEEHGVSAVFAPSAAEMYPAPGKIRFHISELADHLCGKTRPGHFDGVIQVVNKLFNIIEPDIAIFGQKDYQQFQIIRQMCREFDHGVQLAMHPILRETDGLAMSSRNRYLNAGERERAPEIFAVLQRLAQRLSENPNTVDAIAEASQTLQNAGFKIDYISVVDAETLQPLQTASGNCVAAIAVYVGSTRLIDNILLSLPAPNIV